MKWSFGFFFFLIYISSYLFNISLAGYDTKSIFEIDYSSSGDAGVALWRIEGRPVPSTLHSGLGGERGIP